MSLAPARQRRARAKSRDEFLTRHVAQVQPGVAANGRVACGPHRRAGAPAKVWGRCLMKEWGSAVDEAPFARLDWTRARARREPENHAARVRADRRRRGDGAHQPLDVLGAGERLRGLDLRLAPPGARTP